MPTVNNKHKDGGRNEWMEKGWKRERREFMPSRDDSSNTEQVKLCRHVASQQLQLYDWKVGFFGFLSKKVHDLHFQAHDWWINYPEEFGRVNVSIQDHIYQYLSFSLFFRLLKVVVVVLGGLIGFMAALSPGLTPASTGSGWCVNAMRGDLVWEVRALKSNFPGFLSEPGEDSPDGG